MVSELPPPPRAIIRGGARIGCVWFASAPLAKLEICSESVSIRGPFPMDRLKRGEGSILLYRKPYLCKVRLSYAEGEMGSVVFICGNVARVEAVLHDFGWSDVVVPVQLGLRRRWQRRPI